MEHIGGKVHDHTTNLKTIAAQQFLAQKIKRDLIERAKLKKQYAKVKAREQQAVQDSELLSRTSSHTPGSRQEDGTGALGQDAEDDEFDGFSSDPFAPKVPHTLATSPMEPSPSKDDQIPTEQAPDERLHPQRRHRLRPQTFGREVTYAKKKRAEAHERRNTREEAAQQRRQKIEERERFRKAMAKAKMPGRDGKKKLGRESKVLLERVQKMMAS